VQQQHQPRLAARLSTDSTIVTAPAADMSPIEATIVDACNEMHEARELGDAERVAEVEILLDALLDKYDRTEADNHPNAAWAKPNQRAMAMSAGGEVERAIELESVALRYADTPRRKEISLGNLCDRLIRLGRYDEAVEHFLKAREIAPDSVPLMLTGAQALALAGHDGMADRIFDWFLDRREHLEPGSELTAYLEHETRLRDLAPRLPSLHALMALWRAKGGRR